MSEAPPAARTWNNRPGVLAFLAIFWAAEILLGLVLGGVLVAEGKAMPAWMLAIAVALAAFLALVSLRLLLLCLRQLRLPDPIIAMDATGLFDRRLSRAPIPWAEVAYFGILRVRGPQVVFDLTDAGRARVRQPERMLARLNRLILMPPHTLMPMGTTARPADLADAMRAWFNATRPPHNEIGPGADQP